MGPFARYDCILESHCSGMSIVKIDSFFLLTCAVHFCFSKSSVSGIVLERRKFGQWPVAGGQCFEKVHGELRSRNVGRFLVSSRGTSHTRSGTQGSWKANISPSLRVSSYLAAVSLLTIVMTSLPSAFLRRRGGLREISHRPIALFSIVYFEPPYYLRLLFCFSKLIVTWLRARFLYIYWNDVDLNTGRFSGTFVLDVDEWSCKVALHNKYCIRSMKLTIRFLMYNYISS